MNGYIINPMWFYWVSVADGLKTFCIAFPIALFVAGIFFGIIKIADMDDDEKKPFIKTCSIVAAILLAILIMAIFIPSKATLIQMEIAKHATYENTELLMEQIKEASDYILENLK